jgi:hypothetical protein
MAGTALALLLFMQTTTMSIEYTTNGFTLAYLDPFQPTAIRDYNTSTPEDLAITGRCVYWYSFDDYGDSYYDMPNRTSTLMFRLANPDRM